jgi:hypothetical protein
LFHIGGESRAAGIDFHMGSGAKTYKMIHFGPLGQIKGHFFTIGNIAQTRRNDSFLNIWRIATRPYPYINAKLTFSVHLSYG